MPAPGFVARLAEASDDEIQGFFARTLRLAGIPTERACRLLRISERTYFRDLASPALSIQTNDEDDDDD